jgi:hypothetical protein
MHLTLFLCLIFSLELLAFFVRMLGQVLILDKSFTFGAFGCLDSAHVNVVTPLLNLEYLLAVGAWFRSEFTTFFMLAKLTLNCLKAAELALLLHVLSGLMLGLICFGDDLPTLVAFVVDSGALDLVHPKFRFFNLSLAILAKVRLYHLDH